jgi:hypothetical protein
MPAACRALEPRPTKEVENEDDDEDEDDDDSSWAQTALSLSAFLTRKILDHRAGGDSVAFEPTLVDQKGVGDRVGEAWYRGLVVGLHGPDLDDFAVRLNKRD